MAVSLRDLRKVTADKPPRILLYGPPGLGKTTLASEFPGAVFLQTEDGAPGGVDLNSFGLLQSYDALMECITALYSEESDYRTVVLDSLDKLEPLVWGKVCRDNGWPSIEAPGYGKGYVMADAAWREVLDGLTALRRDRGMTVVLIAHSTVAPAPDPRGVEYQRFDVRLHKRALAMVQDDVDCILMVNQEATVKTEDQGFGRDRAHAEGGGTVWIYSEGRPAFVAKNRYQMPAKMLFKKGEGYAALASYLPGQSAAPAPATSKKAA